MILKSIINTNIEGKLKNRLKIVITIYKDCTNLVNNWYFFPNKIKIRQQQDKISKHTMKEAFFAQNRISYIKIILLESSFLS